MIRKPEKFTIDRKSWYRGNGPAVSKLLREDGKMCCVGFFAKACGFSDSDINGAERLEIPLATACAEGRDMGDDVREQDMQGIYGINDNITMHDSQREVLIKDKFRLIGVDVEFKG